MAASVFRNKKLLVLWVWIVAVNLAVHLLGIKNSWLIFLCNIMMFAMEGRSIGEKFIRTEVGGLVGLLLALALTPAVVALIGVIGDPLGYIIPVGLTIAALMLLKPIVPVFFNSTGFLYLIVASREYADYAANVWQYLLTYIVGTCILSGGCLLLLRLLSDKKQ